MDTISLGVGIIGLVEYYNHQKTKDKNKND